MLIADMPNVPPSDQPVVMVAQSDAAQQSTTKSVYESGVCGVLNLGKSSQADVYFVSDANMYFSFDPANWQIDTATARITILQQPKYGRLEPTNKDGDWSTSRYLPNEGYTGDDSFVIRVEGNGYTVKLHYFLNINVGVEFNPNPVCKSVYWKISQDANGNNTLISAAYQSPLTAALNSWH